MYPNAQPSPPSDVPPEPDGITSSALFWIVLVIVGFIAFFAADNEMSADPCSDEVMEAPYEVLGTDEWDRDQRGERVAACLESRLDTYGE